MEKIIPRKFRHLKKQFAVDLSSGLTMSLRILISIFILVFIREAVLLDQNLSSAQKLPTISRKKAEKTEKEVETDRIQQSAMLHRSSQNFCTIDGLFCVPSNYSKYETFDRGRIENVFPWLEKNHHSFGQKSSMRLKMIFTYRFKLL